jgi:pimeloyl-ACP methyl ester carboxylesterase
VRNRIGAFLALFALAASSLYAPAVQFVSVERDVKLQVLDWGGTGRPLLLLTGMGSDAHVYDPLAPTSPRSTTSSPSPAAASAPPASPPSTTANYAADRLGDDVLPVINAPHLQRPMLVGHSIAGEELSSVGSRHPEKIAGLIYLDAGDGYGIYNGVQHLRVLEDSGLVQTEKLGRVRTCRIESSGLAAAQQWIADRRSPWERRLDRLAEPALRPQAHPQPSRQVAGTAAWSSRASDHQRVPHGDVALIFQKLTTKMLRSIPSPLEVVL